MRRGVKFGFAEGTALLAVSLFTNSVFGLDSKAAYSSGNLTYLLLPLSLTLAFLLAMYAYTAAGKAGAGSLAELLVKGTGRLPGTLLGVVLAAVLVLSAAEPLKDFTEVLSRLVYDGVTYWRILFFIMPVTAYIAVKGPESAGRLALIFAGLIALSLAAAVLSASPEFRTYRLFPLPDPDIKEFSAFTLSRGFAFVPPFAAMLAAAKDAGGMRFARRISAAGALAAGAATAGVQFALALIYPRSVLSGLLMPLYRINFLSLSQSYVLRLDKLFIMIWLTGAVISAAFLVSSAGRLLADVFSGDDARPAALTLSALLYAAAALYFGKDAVSVRRLREFTLNSGYLFASLPIAAASSCALIRYSRKERKKHIPERSGMN